MFLNKATAALNMPVEQFPPRQETGDPNSSLQNGEAPPVIEQPRDDNCSIPILCRDDDDDDEGNNGGNGNNGNNGGNNGGNDPTPGNTTPGTGPPTTLPTEQNPGNGNGNGGGIPNGNTFPED
jgi:hypothetical protein